MRLSWHRTGAPAARWVSPSLLPSLLPSPSPSPSPSRLTAAARRGMATEAPAQVKTAGEIAKRIACTQLLLTRWAVEDFLVNRSSDAQDAEGKKRIEDSYNVIQAAVAHPVVAQQFTLLEHRLLKKPLGAWDTEDDLVPVSARWESLGTLLWLLKTLDRFPSPHRAFPRDLLFRTSGIVPAHVDTLTGFTDYFATGAGAQGHVQPTHAVQAAANAVEAWWWRAKAQTVLEMKLAVEDAKHQDAAQYAAFKKSIPSGLVRVMQSIEQAIELAATRSLAEGYIQLVVDKDFGVPADTPADNGAGAAADDDAPPAYVAYRAAPAHRLWELEMQSATRLRALGWYRGLTGWDTGEVKPLNVMNAVWAPANDDAAS
ncbi:hypothetical protein CXG81DRAFT_27652 [Caulochytrium protostelioides]|uniref:Uncharacterized protein n=1 Tax=Caulochytrium protostelioides TaxID=1555241 RepID=A0A4P9X3L0_9FUNG|nr:hypothetical protein CXG81DRAFT_27652 [Caulochytrium protostelioides]|eukprot:RKO99604.1 hypothetical protein CXG81DRAFT_27652 [Caulochytrium protostelioides]